MNVGSLSSYVSGGAIGAFIGLWITRSTMATRKTDQGLVTDVDFFGAFRFTADGLVAQIVFIAICALLGAIIGRLFRKMTLGR